MGYVVAGYTIVLTILFLYGLSLAWRRRRLTRAARRVASFSPVATPNPGAACGDLGGVEWAGWRAAPPMTTAPPVPPPEADGAGAEPDRSARARPPTVGPSRRPVTGCATPWSARCWSGAFAFLVVKGLGSALNFYLPADQAVHKKPASAARPSTSKGVVEPGSIHSTPNGVNFVVTSGRTSVQVDNTGSPPQLFQPNIPVIAVGHFNAGTFVSDQILVKHSANYIAAHPGRVTAPNGTKR